MAKLRRMEEAVAQYREARRIKPYDAKACFNWGMVMEDAGNREEAARQYREALALDPTYADAQGRLSVLLGDSGTAQEAPAAVAPASRRQRP